MSKINTDILSNSKIKNSLMGRALRVFQNPLKRWVKKLFFLSSLMENHRNYRLFYSSVSRKKRIINIAGIWTITSESYRLNFDFRQIHLCLIKTDKK